MQTYKQSTQPDLVQIQVPMKYRTILEQTIEWLVKGEGETYNTHFLQLKQLTDRLNDKLVQESLYPICELDKNFLTTEDLRHILETVPEYTFSVKMLHTYLCHLRCTGWKGKLVRIETVYKWNVVTLYEFKKQSDEVLSKYWHWNGTATHRKQIEYLAGLEIARGTTRKRDDQIRKWIQENHQKNFISLIDHV